MKRIYEFLFSRWKKEIYKRGEETWFKTCQYSGVAVPNSEYKRDYVEYKFTNKFDGSTKIKREYLN